MTYYKDLDRCGYFGERVPPDVLAVGWIARGCAFAKGDPGQRFFAKLKHLIAVGWTNPLTMYCGHHECELCRYDPSTSWYNLFVPGHGVSYAAPEGIVHYIAAHGYCPPQVFRDAVMDCPDPRTPAYFDALRQCGWTQEQLRPDPLKTPRHVAKLASQLRSAVADTFLAYAAWHDHEHGHVPASIDALDDAVRVSGLVYRRVDQKKRLSLQRRTVGEVVEIKHAEEWYARFKELRGGDWRDHQGFAERKGKSERALQKIHLETERLIVLEERRRRVLARAKRNAEGGGPG